MNRIMKGVAAVSVAALAASGLALVTAGSANAATSSNADPYQCTTVIQAGTFAASTQPTYTVNLNASGVTPGSNIIVTGAYTPALNNGPVALADYTGSNRLKVSYQVNGGAVQTVVGAYGTTTSPANIAANAAVPNPTPGNVTIPGASLVDGDVVTILPTGFEQQLTSSSLGGQSGSTDCVPTVTPDTALTVNVLNAASASITAVSGQTSPTVARSGQVATLAGSAWGPSDGGTFTRQWCTADGITCSASVAAPDLVAASGTLSGTVAVGGAGLGTGARSLKVTAAPSGQSVTIPITILGTRTATITPAQGGANSVITVNVTNFDSGSTITAYGATSVLTVAAGAPGCAPACNISVAAGETADTGTTGIAGADGSGSATLTVTNAATVAISAIQGPLTPIVQTSPAAVIAFGQAATYAGNFTYGVNSCDIAAGATGAAADCSTIQFINANVLAGQLTLSQLDGSVQLSDVTLNGSAQQATGALNQLTIVDARGTDAGWAITGALTNFQNATTTGANTSIPATNMSWTPSCAAVSGTTGTPVAGTGGAFVAGDTGVTDTQALAGDASSSLCTLAAGQGGGTFTADAGLSLTVPATVKTGDYKATMYLQIA